MTILPDQTVILCSCNVIQEGHILEIFQIYIFMIDMVGKMRRKKIVWNEIFQMVRQRMWIFHIHTHTQTRW